MKMSDEPPWKAYMDEYRHLSDKYVRMIERSLGGEHVDYASEFRELLFWDFGLWHSQTDVLDAIESLYATSGIPPESTWRDAGGLKAFREWKRTHWKNRARIWRDDGGMSVRQLQDIQTSIMEKLHETGHPVHYRNLTELVSRHDKKRQLSPATVNFCCQGLREEELVKELAPGIWSDSRLPGGSHPVSISDIKARIIDKVIPGWKGKVFLYEELSGKGPGMSSDEMEEDARRVFEHLGFHAERRGKPGQTDVVAWDSRNVLITECKAMERFPLLKLARSISRHVKEVQEDRRLKGRKHFYIVLSHDFSPRPKKSGGRMHQRHLDYIVEIEKQVGMLVIPITFGAFRDLLPLAQEQRLLPQDLVSLLVRTRRSRNRGVWWGDIRDYRKKPWKRLPLSVLFDDLYPMLSGMAGKMRKEEVVEEMANAYKYRDSLTFKEIQEAKRDLTVLLDILLHLDILEENKEWKLALQVDNPTFLRRRLEEWFFGKPWEETQVKEARRLIEE